MNRRDKKATALSYDQQTDVSPKVTATGRGLVAEEIIERAKEHNVPIVEDESLVELLSTLEINETIPPELYEAVAEVFAFVYNVDKMSK
ncbi:MAG TPA: EscU/YscU/HrcU family type III secretion system export apparatus switch protein [Pseudogracilibacillus sp.]|nr:EscU/YscU/HrcU family type III secretion system export apparatus switch protein [Pseudogracilibacillus sp.]